MHSLQTVASVAPADNAFPGGRGVTLAAACTDARKEIRNYALRSLGIRNWRRRRRLRPYGGICVLLACWRSCYVDGRRVAGHPLAQNERCLHMFLLEPNIDKDYVPGKVRTTWVNELSTPASHQVYTAADLLVHWPLSRGPRVTWLGRGSFCWLVTVSVVRYNFAHFYCENVKYACCCGLCRGCWYCQLRDKETTTSSREWCRSFESGRSFVR